MWSCTKEPVLSEAPERDVPDVSVPDDDNIVSGWVRIKLADDAAPLCVGAFTRGEVESGDPRLDEIAQELGATEIRRVFRDGGRFAERRRRYGLHLWYDIKIGEDVPVSRAEAGIAAVPGVAHVQPIYKAKLTDHRVIPAMAADMKYKPAALDASRPVLSPEEYPFNDPGLPQQWHYYNDGSLEKAVEGADINLFKGWEINTGRPDVIVAVVDMGVQYDHPDLAANMWINEAEMNGTEGVDDDDNGYVDDLYGWNFAPNYDSGEIVPGYHGTHIAGTIAAVNNNGEGVCGIAGGSGNGDGVRIMTIGWSADNRQTIPNWDMFAYAADNGAVIASCSWEVSSPDLAPDLQAGLDYFIDNAGMDENGVQTGPMKGGLIMFAAGNSGENRLKFPSYYDRVVSVASMAPDYNKASYSNWAPEVDILAPGGEKNFGEAYAVYSTYTDSGYAYIEGTSMATPHVSGVAALIVSEYGKEGFTSDDLRKRLLASFRPISPVVSGEYANQIGVGLVDASLITLEDPGVSPGALENYGAEGLPDSVRIYCRVPADGNGNAVAQFVVEYAPKEGGGTPGGGTVANRYDVGQTMVYTFEGLYNTDYEINVRSIDRFGNSSEAVSGSVSIGNFENRPPERTSERMADVSMPDTAETSIVSITLTPYFTDPDLEYGDELSYSATSVNEDIVATEVAGEVLRLIPRAKGTSLVTVTASDLAGATVSFSIYATVAGGTGPSGDDGAVAISPNPVADRLNVRLGDTEGEAAVRIYDGAARLVMEAREEIVGGGVELDVSRLSPGAYSLVAEGGGRTVRGTFVKR